MVTVAPTMGAPLISVTVPKTSPLLCGLGPGLEGKEEPEPPQPPRRTASPILTVHKMSVENHLPFFLQGSNHPDIYRYPSSEEPLRRLTASTHYDEFLTLKTFAHIVRDDLCGGKPEGGQQIITILPPKP